MNVQPHVAARRVVERLRHGGQHLESQRARERLDVMTSDDYGVPITDVMPMGGLLNVDCTANDHQTIMVAAERGSSRSRA